ncbi:MAG: tRNA uridine-5-carboxymethylaminomethyl(34) synthesis GTPase MnmE [Fimbriimonadaceae bacterium]
MRLGDTIIAPITGLGGAVAVIRLSGPMAFEIAANVFSGLPDSPVSHRAYYGKYKHQDDGICTLFDEGRSYTGEKCAELSLHGSVASVRQLMAACLQHDCRTAEPGEFTWRAFANGRLDLSQAEAVRDTVEAETESALRAANRMRQGGLRSHIQLLSMELTKTLGAIEASVDFSEEIGEFDRGSGIFVIESVLMRIDLLLATATSGRILRHGFRVALVGRPNAGKSSLLNALLKSNRSIVTAEAGTTRDYIEERVDLGGLPCVLIDTAGLRDSASEAEAIGVVNSRAIIAEADLVLYLFDSVQGLQPEDQEELAALRDAVLVATKSDLSGCKEGLAISSVTGEGLKALEQTVIDRCQMLDVDGIYIQDRHEIPIQLAKTSCLLARDILATDLPYDLAVTGLRDAISSLGEVTGETASADMIERIFADFCIGK